jgi:proteasome activator subunit 4
MPVCSFLITCYALPTTQAIFEHIVDFLPEVFYMQDDDDPDLQSASTRVLEYFALSDYPSESVPKIIEAFRTVSKSQSWHVRQKLLLILQIFWFHHIFSLSKERAQTLLDIITTEQLIDLQLEVRLPNLLVIYFLFIS